MIILALLLASLQPPDPVEGAPFSETQPVRLAPLPAARALGAFRDICMAGFPDAAAFERAAAGSDLGFVRRTEPAPRTLEYSSPHGQILLRQAPNRQTAVRRDRREGRSPRARWQVRCDFWVAVEEPLEPSVLIALIGHQLADGRPPLEEIVSTSWDLGDAAGGGRLKLVYLPSDDDPRLFTLSLERLGDSPAR